MKRHVAGGKFQPGVRLHQLTRHAGRAAVGAVTVAAEAQFIFMRDGGQHPAARADAGDIGQRPGDLASGAGGTVGGMGIMAIRAGDVTNGRIDQIFARTMRVQFQGNGMDAELFKIRRDIFPGAVTAMAVKAVILRRGKAHQSRLRGGGMGRVATGAGGVRHRRGHDHLAWQSTLGARDLTGQGRRHKLAGNGMCGAAPAGQGVTGHAELGTAVVHDQKTGVLIVVRIMTGGALHLAAAVQGDLRRQGGRINQATGGGIGAGGVGQRGIVNERNGMIRRKINAEVAGVGQRVIHGNAAGLAVHQAERHRAVVTAQA